MHDGQNEQIEVHGDHCIEQRQAGLHEVIPRVQVAEIQFEVELIEVVRDAVLRVVTATVVVRLVLGQMVFAGRRLVAGRRDLRTDAVVVTYGRDVVHLGLVLIVEDVRAQVAVRLRVHQTLMGIGLFACRVLRYFDFGLQTYLRRIRDRR